jgi:K+-transporting ATPase ATPase C chain
MSQVRELFRAMRLMLILWLITTIAYPLIILAVGQIAFPIQANGSLMQNNQDKTIGSALIGQPFTRDEYFWSRPSAIAYSTIEDASLTGISGASNLAPSNPELYDRIEREIKHLKMVGIKPTADLVYTSGSGLDPHISLEGARNQLSRVAKARDLDSNQIEILISKYTESRFLNIFGEPGVNVLKLNLALDKLTDNLSRE